MCFLHPVHSAKAYSLNHALRLYTGSWRKIEIPMDTHGTYVTSIHPSPCLFFNGALHSLVSPEVLCFEGDMDTEGDVEVEVMGDMEEDSHKFKAVGDVEEDSHRLILSFNVDDEKFHEIKLPEKNLCRRHSECLVMLKGSLAFIGFSLADS